MKIREWMLVAGVTLAVSLGASTLRAASIIDNWASVKAPPAPELKQVKIDPKTTALLVLDMVNQFCPRYPHCPEMIPTIKKLITEARATSVAVIYTSIPQFAEADVVKELAPTRADPFVQSFLNKFLNTDLEKILKDKGIKSIIVVGLAANGAVIDTSSQAAQKGFGIIVPVDAIAATTPYAEQFSVWQLGNAPVISPKITLTTSDMIKF